MNLIIDMKDRVFGGEELTKSDILQICRQVILREDVNEEGGIELEGEAFELLCSSADEIRMRFTDGTMDLCSIINGKSGRCSEDCKFCSQSSYNSANIEEYAMIGEREIVELAERNCEKGVSRFSVVTSGRKLSKSDIEKISRAVVRIKERTKLSVCVSPGIIDEEDLITLRDAGVERIHNNIETSRGYFPNICTTHSFDDKIRTINLAKKVGLQVCSGGIIGMGESLEDRIDMGIFLRELEVDSIPVNFLNPIPGTKLEKNRKMTEREARFIIALYRFMMPKMSIRLAGGRSTLEYNGEMCFSSGANAAISGDMLTTDGISIEKDVAIFSELGYKYR